jgi:hypothetical protein
LIRLESLKKNGKQILEENVTKDSRISQQHGI